MAQLDLAPSEEVKEDITRIRNSFHRPRVWILCFGWCLAVCAGAANVIAFKQWNVYASHATGSTTAIAFGLEGYQQGEQRVETLIEASLLVSSFFLGAWTCGLLIDKNQVHFGKGFYGLALVINSGLLSSAAFISGRWLPVCLVAAALGLQNAMCTSHFGAIFRTTHVTGTVTDIGSTLGRISIIYLRKGCRRSRLSDVELAEVGVDRRKLAVLLGLWSCYFAGGLVGVYVENYLTGPPQRVLLVPGSFTGFLGVFYMTCRQMLKKFVKNLEQERFESDLVQAHDALKRMLRQLHSFGGSIPSTPSTSMSTMDLETGNGVVEDISSSSVSRQISEN